MTTQCTAVRWRHKRSFHTHKSRNTDRACEGTRSYVYFKQVQHHIPHSPLAPTHSPPDRQCQAKGYRGNHEPIHSQGHTGSKYIDVGFFWRISGTEEDSHDQFIFFNHECVHSLFPFHILLSLLSLSISLTAGKIVPSPTLPFVFSNQTNQPSTNLWVHGWKKETQGWISKGHLWEARDTACIALYLK